MDDAMRQLLAIGANVMRASGHTAAADSYERAAKSDFERYLEDGVEMSRPMTPAESDWVYRNLK